MTMFEHDESAALDFRGRQVLARYLPRIVPVRVEALGNRGGFSGAGIWRVITNAGDFALRQWPSPGLPSERIAGLHRLLEHLHGQGVTFVSVPLTTGGITVLRDIAHDWQLEPWMPGEANFHTEPSTDRLISAMTALAQWHLAAARFVPTSQSSQWFSTRGPSPSPAVAERLTILAGANETAIHRIESRTIVASTSLILDLARRILELFRIARTRVIAELELVRDVPVPLQPCLRDVWHDHLLFSGDKVTGIIDPSACRTESVACDLSRLIGSLVGDDPDHWKLALHEYQRFRSLSIGERALLTVFDRSGVLLSGWKWLEWLYLDRRPFPDLNAVTSRLTEILKRMESLFGRNDQPPMLVVS